MKTTEEQFRNEVFFTDPIGSSNTIPAPTFALGKASALLLLASLFVLEVQQSGVFVVNVPQSRLKQTIEINCASYLHVYLSQTISNAIIQAGFPPIVLQPLQPIITQEQLFNQNNDLLDATLRN